MKKIWKIAAGILCVTLIGGSLAGCAEKNVEKVADAVTTNTENKEENEQQSNLNVIRPQAYSNVEGLTVEKGTYLSIIGKETDSQYWQAVKTGAERAVKDINDTLGYKGEDKVKLSYSGPSKADSVDEQINILDEELSRYPLAVGIASIDASACTVQFDLAGENGVPIIAFDSGNDYQDIQATCSTNNIDAAQTAASKLSSAIEKTGEVAVFVHDSKSKTGKERETGFVEKIKESSPNVSVVNVYYMDELDVVAKQIAQEKSTEAQIVAPESITQEDVVKYIFDKNPNIKGCYGTSVDATQLIVKALDTLKKTDVQVVGFDGGTEQLKALEAGKIEGLIVQNPYGMGYATVVASMRATLNKGNEAFIDTGYTWVTKDNMDKKTIKSMLY